MKYQLTLNKGDKYIILENNKDIEYIQMMLKWYISHSEFFNGEFKIREV